MYKICRYNYVFYDNPHWANNPEKIVIYSYNNIGTLGNLRSKLPLPLTVSYTPRWYVKSDLGVYSFKNFNILNKILCDTL